MNCCSPGSSVHGILQARILEWVAISYSRGSSQPRDQTMSPGPGRQIPYHCTTGKTRSWHKDFLLNSWDVLRCSFGRSCYSEREERILLGFYLAGSVSRFRQRGSSTSGKFLNVFFLMTQMFTSADPSLVWTCFPFPW